MYLHRKESEQEMINRVREEVKKGRMKVIQTLFFTHYPNEFQFI